MNGDFARMTFDPARHFSRVLLQQGRMLLEADYNEQSAIHHHFLRTLVVDLVGRCWRAGDGFTLAAGKQNDFQISRGHLYIDGILCENDADCTYATQPHGPVPAQPAATDGFMAYIECWERHVSPVQLADLREIALGGRDTATRSQIAWQVRTASGEWAKDQAALLDAALGLQVQNTAAPAGKAAVQALKDKIAPALAGFLDALGKIGVAGEDAANCAKAVAFIDLLDLAQPQMRAIARRSADTLDACAIAADSEYRGRENQLYRVEIHGPGAAGDATFKWSRENASIAFRVADEGMSADGNQWIVELEDLGHDRRTGLCEGTWVEIGSEAFEFGGVAASLAQVKRIEKGRRQLTLQVDPADKTDFTAATWLRRWDQSAGLDASGTITVAEGAGNNGWITLERGIQVQFSPGGLYRTGDYWLIPARVANGDILWPRTAAGPTALPPGGLKRHRGPIGYGKKVGAAWTFTPCGCTQMPLCP